MTHPLAVLGSPPAFNEPRHVGMPNIPDRAVLHARLDELLDTRRLTNDGPFVRRFEAMVADMTGARHAVAMCNATLGLQVLMRALNISGEVIMPSFTFVATAHAAQWEGLQPVFVDVDPISHTLDPACTAAAVTPRTGAIVGVHLWGSTCDVDALDAVAQAAGVPLIFDAAHALGCSYKGRPLASLGVASVVSFHATKVAHSLEGGAVLTNDDALAAKLRLMRNFGFQGYDRVSSLGTNAKMNEMCAVFGLGCLEEFDRIVDTNRQHMARYKTRLAPHAGLEIYPYAAGEKTNWQYVVVRVDPALSPLSRDELVEVLHIDNVLARKYFSPGCHRLPPYCDMAVSRQAELPVTERLSREILALPTGTGVCIDDIDTICACIEAALAQAPQVRAALVARRTSTAP